MLITNARYVKDIDGRYFTDSSSDKYSVEPNGIYGRLIIQVQEVR